MAGPLVAILSGAGISTDSGIPDYRGPNGLWRRDPEAEKLATYEYYMGDPEIRRRSWQARRAICTSGPGPPPARCWNCTAARRAWCAPGAARGRRRRMRWPGSRRASRTRRPVHPAAGLVAIAADGGARLVIVNASA